MSEQIKPANMQATEKKRAFQNENPYFLEISTLDSLENNREEMDNPVRRPYFQIIWITRGKGHFTIDLEKYRMADNTIYTIPSGRFHQCKPAGEVSGFILSFDGDFLKLAIEAADRPFFKEICADLSRVNMIVLQAHNPVLQNLLADMTREASVHQTMQLEILSSLFKIFLMYMKRLATTTRQEEASSHKMRLFNSFYAKLEKQFKTMKQVAEYANELSVSPSYLTDVVKRVSGFSASYHIQQRMVQEAKRLAIYSDASMKMVAYHLGFDDLSHFSKFFKNAAGINFSDFKKQKDRVA
jgi:AraC family transcriptional activator of pobA